MQSYHVVLMNSLPYFLQWYPFLIFSELCTIFWLLPDSWQMASAHTSQGKLKLSDGNFISSLPSNQQTYLYLYSLSLSFFPILSHKCISSCLNPFPPLMLWIWPLLPLSGTTPHCSFFLLYWSFWWSLKTCSSNHKSSFGNLTNLFPSRDSLKEIAVYISCPIFLFYTYCSVHPPINPPEQFFKIADDLHIPAKASLKNSSLQLICQEYLTRWMLSPFWNSLFPWLWWPHIVLDFLLFFTSSLCNFFCRLLLLYPVINVGVPQGWVPGCLLLSLYPVSLGNQCLPKHSSKYSHYTMAPKVYLWSRSVHLTANWHLLFDATQVLHIQDIQDSHDSPQTQI